MWPKVQVLAAFVAVIGVCQLVKAAATLPLAELQVGHATSLLPQQLSQQNVTASTSSLSSMMTMMTVMPKADTKQTDETDDADDDDDDDDILSDSNKELNKPKTLHTEPKVVEVADDLLYVSSGEVASDQDLSQQLGSKSGFLPTALPNPQQSKSPTNGHGYIQFDIDEPLPAEAKAMAEQARQKSKKSVVNEVLSSLFPNGFSDIFRFTGSEANTDAATVTTTTKTVLPAPAILIESSTTTESLPKKNDTYYSYRTTVTKEYRREVRPGHTEIVVEKISSPEQMTLREGSNHISKDELLRINRAAVASPVLPSLLLQPENEDNETLVAAESAPIVILGEQDVDLEDSQSQSFEDNQIAETRNHYQGRYLKPPQSEKVESYNQQDGPAENQHIDVHISHEDDSGKAASQPAHDHYQGQSHQQFSQKYQEAPSRQFLKTFKPVVSGSADGPIPKGVFHYESGHPTSRSNFKPPKEIEYPNHAYERPAAQLTYQRELNPQNPSSSQLHTKAIPSPTEEAPSTPAPYAGPTAHSLVYVTVNSPSPPKQHDQEAPKFPSPHDYVSEAAAEPSQHSVQQVLPPKHHSQPETQLLVKPNGYTFVEVQKSVNIHNKLITEKDGQLVEMHETIYPPSPSYQQNHLTAGHSPKDYVTAAKSEVPLPHANPSHYNSLAAHPIHVEHEHEHGHGHDHGYEHGYENSPQGSSVSDVTVNHGATVVPTAVQHHHEEHYALPLEQHHEHHQEHLPVQEILEKHIPIPYAVPQPVAVPVHVEHFVDRPYPVETIIEQPVPYTVEKIVEKIVEKKVPFEVEKIVEKPVEIEKIVEKFIDRPMAVPIHVPVAIHLPMPPAHSHAFNFHSHPNALHPWSHGPSIAHIPPKVLQNYYNRMLKKLMPQFAVQQFSPVSKPKEHRVKPPVKPVRGEAPKVATFSEADMRFDLRPPPPPEGSTWLQGARYIYNTLPADLSAAAAGAAPVHMVKSYIGPVPTTSTKNENNGIEFDEFQRWRNGHSLKRSPDFGRNLHMEYGFKPPLVPSLEIDDKGMPLKQPEAES